MWPYHPDLLATPVPRYTSYPTAAEFAPLAPDRHHAALAGATGYVSLYLHIPFCEKICFYCGCNTGAAGRAHRLESYLAALHAEIDTVAAIVSPTCRVGRIAFGGGSPNAIAPAAFAALLDHLARAFRLDTLALSIELDPRTLAPDWFAAIADAGVTRASLGVQTFAPHCQRAIGRVQDAGLIARAVEGLRGAGVTSLNFDLMYGLPGQTRADLADTLARSAALGADRIALFGYAHVPHIVRRQRAIDATDLPDQTERFAMAALGFAQLTEAGYEPIGFDHFALPGDPMAAAARAGMSRRNFQGFTDDPAETLIGLGASAISAFPGLLAQNEKNSGRYRMLAGDGRLTTVAGIARDAPERQRGAAIEGLLCHGAADLPGWLAAEVRPRIARFCDRGLAWMEDDRLTIAPEALPYARTIAATLDRWRQTDSRQFSSAV